MSRRLFELILSIKRKCQSNEEQIQDELGLSQAEFNGLIVLEPGQKILGFDFADRMGLSPSRGSRVLNKLVTEGYVKTQVKADDRRTVLIGLTAKGTRKKKRILGRMEACENRISAKLTKRQIGQIRSALSLLEEAL
ncbi:MAG: MarR family transcriptional regulator [Phycisphaerales bacterium]|nr:MAG: MarR family transcriptional regulator [Phycisphaerales bacterium]